MQYHRKSQSNIVTKSIYVHVIFGLYLDQEVDECCLEYKAPMGEGQGGWLSMLNSDFTLNFAHDNLVEMV